MSRTRNIPRVWEVDWAVDASGQPWSAYPWALSQARELQTHLSIVAGTYGAFEHLDLAIGRGRAYDLARGSHQFTEGGVHVKAVRATKRFHVSGVVLVAWATDNRLAHVEGQYPAAVAAVPSLPDDIRIWRGTCGAPRIGERRPDIEADFESTTVAPLDPRAAAALSSSGAMINQNHAAMDTDERRSIAGALLAIRDAGLPASADALRAHLMSEGWSGPIINQTLELAQQIAAGKTPSHHSYGPV